MNPLTEGSIQGSILLAAMRLTLGTARWPSTVAMCSCLPKVHLLHVGGLPLMRAQIFSLSRPGSGMEEIWTIHWPESFTLASMVDSALQTLQAHCKKTRLLWLPTPPQHGGVEQLQVPIRVEQRQLVTCLTTRLAQQPIDRTLFEQLARKVHPAKRSGTYLHGTSQQHEILLNMSSSHNLELVDIFEMSMARADAHVVDQDECAHWCVPGVPDVWANALLYHMCVEKLADGRTCVAA